MGIKERTETLTYTCDTCGAIIDSANISADGPDYCSPECEAVADDAALFEAEIRQGAPFPEDAGHDEAPYIENDEEYIVGIQGQ